MSEWRIIVNDGEQTLTNSDGLFDVETVKTFNPFGDYARAKFDDLEGELFDIFQRGTKVEFEYNADYTTGFVQDFVGFVVSGLENESAGAEELEIEAYTFDQFLRGDEVSTDLTGLKISDALQTVITTDIPPVEYDSTLVSVVDDVELTRSYKGEKVEDFLLDVRKQSSGEIFTVNENLKFVFELPEISRTRRDIDNTQWITHNISEKGGETKNQVRVFYDGGDRAVTVDDSSDQLSIQDNLGAVGPAQEGESITLEDVTNINDAINAGEAYLEKRASTLTGPVTTSELVDAQPGNVIGVTVAPRGIDTDFRIAENRTQWRGETNELVVVSKKGAEDDILIEQSKTVKRVENRPRNTDVVPDRVTDTKVTATFDVNGSAEGVTTTTIASGQTQTVATGETLKTSQLTVSGELIVEGEVLVELETITKDTARFVNDGRNRVRDALINNNVVSSINIQLSTSNARPNRSDSTVANVVDTQTPTVNISGNTITYTATSTAAGIQTIAIVEAGTNTLLAESRLSEPVSEPSVELSVTVDNDPSVQKAVITESGQDMLIDILTGTTPNYPQFYAYGSGTIEPTEADNSLTTEVVRQDLDDITIQTANTTTQWDSIVEPIASTQPVRVRNDQVELLQTSFTQTASDIIAIGTYTATAFSNTDPSYESSTYLSFDTVGQYAEYDITLDYDIPLEFNLGRLVPKMRGIASGGVGASGGTFAFFVDGEKVGEIFVNGDLEWANMGITNIDQAYPADTYTVRFELVSKQKSGDDIDIDMFSVVDDRFTYTYDNTLDANNHLSGPELYPPSQEVSLSTAETQRVVSTATFTSTWNDTSNNQYIELANDGTNYTRISNSSSGSVSFSSAEVGVDTRINLSRYGQRTSQTPTSGFAGQAIQEWRLNADPQSLTKDKIGVLQSQVILPEVDAVNESFAEAALLDSSGTALTHSLIPKFTKSDQQQVISAEKIRFENP